MSSQETFSITTLQRMCARSEYLDESDIHMNDKTVSWDGNIIYYKEIGSTVDEFIYLIETLMMYELIAENCITRIRHCARDKATTAKQNFISAIEKYCVMWDYSESMKSIFNKIEFEEVIRPIDRQTT